MLSRIRLTEVVGLRRRWTSLKQCKYCFNTSLPQYDAKRKHEPEPRYERRYRFMHRFKAAILGASSYEDPEPSYDHRKGRTLEDFVVHHNQPFYCQYGGVLSKLQLVYEAWGTLNSKKDNVILLQHGLSASPHARSHLELEQSSPGWWEKFIGPSLSLDTDKYYIICMNHIGSCYGTTGPSSVNPKGKKPYGGDFPIISITDMVEAQFLLLDHLGIERIHAFVGASLGGCTAFMAGALYPNQIDRIVSISAGANSPPSAIAFRYLQRCALMSDPKWNNGHYYDTGLPINGTVLARKIATLTYRSGPEWNVRFQHKKIDDEDVLLPRYDGTEFKIEDYIRHQGEMFLTKTNYDPNSLIYLSKASDIFDMGEGFDSIEEGFSRVKSPTLILGASSDILYPPICQQEAARYISEGGNPDVILNIVEGHFGHDTFLLDVSEMGSYMKAFIES